MRARARIAVLYAVFAGISTLANLGSQWGVLSVRHDRIGEYLALLVGTAVGMPIKYLLDKRWIFRFDTDGLWHDARLFVLYLGMAVVTTVVFWAVELVVGRATGTTVGYMVGGGLGLTLGYLAKYRLDKRYVFVRQEVPA